MTNSAAGLEEETHETCHRPTSGGGAVNPLFSFLMLGAAYLAATAIKKTTSRLASMHFGLLMLLAFLAQCVLLVAFGVMKS
jgi:hypothetical protein